MQSSHIDNYVNKINVDYMQLTMCRVLIYIIIIHREVLEADRIDGWSDKIQCGVLTHRPWMV